MTRLYHSRRNEDTLIDADDMGSNSFQTGRMIGAMARRPDDGAFNRLFEHELFEHDPHRPGFEEYAGGIEGSWASGGRDGSSVDGGDDWFRDYANGDREFAEERGRQSRNFYGNHVNGQRSHGNHDAQGRRAHMHSPIGLQRPESRASQDFDDIYTGFSSNDRNFNADILSMRGLHRGGYGEMMMEQYPRSGDPWMDGDHGGAALPDHRGKSGTPQGSNTRSYEDRFEYYGGLETPSRSRSRSGPHPRSYEDRFQNYRGLETPSDSRFRSYGDSFEYNGGFEMPYASRTRSHHNSFGYYARSSGDPFGYNGDSVTAYGPGTRAYEHPFLSMALPTTYTVLAFVEIAANLVKDVLVGTAAIRVKDDKVMFSRDVEY